MEKEIQTLKEFIHEKFESHEELEALRFKRIDELLSQYGKESEGNSETIKRVHIRVDRIEQSYKTLRLRHRYCDLFNGCGCMVWLDK